MNHPIMFLVLCNYFQPINAFFYRYSFTCYSLDIYPDVYTHGNKSSNLIILNWTTKA